MNAAQETTPTAGQNGSNPFASLFGNMGMGAPATGTATSAAPPATSSASAAPNTAPLPNPWAPSSAAPAAGVLAPLSGGNHHILMCPLFIAHRLWHSCKADADLCRKRLRAQIQLIAHCQQKEGAPLLAGACLSRLSASSMK